MTIKFINDVDLGEFVLIGRLDSTNALECENTLMEVIEKNSFTTIVFDFEGLKYVSSAGLRIFMKIYMLLKKAGGNMVAKSVPDNIMDVFEMTGFVSLFKFE